MNFLQLNEILSQVQIFEGIVGLLGNVLVCLTILKTKSLHSTTNFMLLNLAVADLIVSLFLIAEPYGIKYFRGHIAFDIPCTAFLVYNFTSFFIIQYFQRVISAHSVLGLTLATFERYVGIIKPLHYSTFLSKRRIVVLLMIIWISPVFIELHCTVFYVSVFQDTNCTVPSMMTHELELITDNTVRFILLFIIPSIAIAFMYTRILLNLKRGAQHLENQGIQGPPQELHRAHKKVTQSLVLVISAFFILLLPAQIMRNSIVYTNYFGGQLMKAEVTNKIVSLLTSLNSSINPILYGFKYSQLRRACIAMLCPFKCYKRHNQVHIIADQM